MQDPAKLSAVVEYAIWALITLVGLWALLNGKFRLISPRDEFEQLAYDVLDEKLLADRPSPARYVGRQIAVALVVLVVGAGALAFVWHRSDLPGPELPAVLDPASWADPGESAFR